MKIVRHLPSLIQIIEMESFHADLLRQLPFKMQSAAPEVKARLFPNPYQNDEELASDWQEHVTPSLAAHFQSAEDIVRKDFESMKQDEAEHYTLSIPMEHLHPWIHVLNQTRITLTALHDFSEEEMELRKLPTDPQSCMDLYLINLYGYILSSLVDIAQTENQG